MKPKINFFSSVLLFLALILLFGLCTKNETISLPEFEGALKLHIDLAVVVYENTPATRAIDAGAFKVEIFKKNGSSPVKTFEHASELPESIALAEGEYYVTASYGSAAVPAFDNPCYYGKSETFLVVSKQTSNVSLVCKPSNARVTIVYSDRVISSFNDYYSMVFNTTDTLTFAKGESRAGYFKPGTLHLKSVLSYLSGATTISKTISGNISSAAAGKHYEVHIDTSPDGFDAITISVNESFETILVNLTDDGASVPEEPSGPGNGNLLITEIMCDPDKIPDAEGEWIEIYNNSGTTVNLNGMILRRSTSSTTPHTITSDVILVPGDYAVIGKTTGATNNVDYACEWLNLTNSGLELSIETSDGTVLCCIDFRIEGFDMPPAGKSLQLNPSVTTIDGARLGSNWCAATLAYSTGDFGTPGAVNSACQ
ncbi:MAG: DUF4493 domain-containing protein [Prolixibacteraceae bacterium]